MAAMGKPAAVTYYQPTGKDRTTIGRNTMPPSARRHSFRGLAAAAMLALLVPWPARAQAPTAWPQQHEADLVVHDFHFADGESLPELKLHYLTIGTKHTDASGAVTNAVLLLHGTTGTGRNFLAPSLANELFMPGQPLDASKYFIIMPDGIGRGGSSKPSDGLAGKFPHYGYKDVVEGQYRVVSEGLGLRHLHLILGTSMGGMQAWLWAEEHPAMADGVVTIASQPAAVSGRNMMWRRTIIEAIRSDPDWHDGAYASEPKNFVRFLPVFNFMVESAARLQEMAPTRAKANELYDQWIANYARTTDANDYLYWFESSADYDPEPDLEKITAPLLAINSADDMLNPPETGIMAKLMPRVAHGSYVLLPASDKTHGHQTLTLAAIWKPYVAEFMTKLQ
jgi:homoserine O-acetyltransferase